VGWFDYPGDKRGSLLHKVLNCRRAFAVVYLLSNTATEAVCFVGKM
jgi:hypothetical protein